MHKYYNITDWANLSRVQL